MLHLWPELTSSILAVVLYLDDSGSMRAGSRIKDLAKIAEKVADASLKFDDGRLSRRSHDTLAY